MSNALAISGVSAVLQYCLNLVYSSPASVLGSVSVSALAPDIVQNTLGSGTNAQLQVNVFMHQAKPNAAWRNIGFPSLAPDGGTRLKNPPLALDLHYLLTAYAAEDTQAEALLGYAILMLHENPILPRSLIRTALSSVPNTNPLWNFLSTTGLADQIEMIKIEPSTLGREELAWLWTALKADYRPTFSFQVSVVLIEPQVPTSFSLPVLSRNLVVQAGPPAQVLTVAPPNSQVAASPGDLVTLTGQSLDGASQVILSNPRLGIHYPPFAPTSVSGTTVTFKVPDDPADFPAGVYNLSLLFLTSGAVTGTTNIVALPVAPAILPFGAGAAVANAEGTLVTVGCKPQILPNQSVSLALAGPSVSAQLFETPTAAPAFQFPTLAAGSYLARLQVDGVPSNVTVQWTPLPPVFTGPFLTVV
jgi:hypothetical protein